MHKYQCATPKLASKHQIRYLSHVRNLIFYILINHTIAFAGLFDVNIETTNQEPDIALFRKATTQLSQQLTAESQHAILSPLSDNAIIDLIDAYHFTKMSTGHFEYHVSFNTEKIKKLLAQHKLSFIPQSSRPFILIMPSENTPNTTIERLINSARQYGFEAIIALMDTQDLQAWLSLTHEQDNTSIDQIADRYKTSQIIATDDSENDFKWYNQHIISNLITTPENAITQIAEGLKAQYSHQTKENQIQIEIHGIKNLTDQQNMLASIKNRVKTKSIEITNIKPTFVILTIVYSGGIEAFITDMGEPEVFTASMTQNTNTDLAYEWHPKTA